MGSEAIHLPRRGTGQSVVQLLTAAFAALALAACATVPHAEPAAPTAPEPRAIADADEEGAPPFGPAARTEGRTEARAEVRAQRELARSAAPAVDGAAPEAAEDLELELIRFTSRRRALSAETPRLAGVRAWSPAMLAAWATILGALEAGLAAAPGTLPRRLLIQTRVTLEVELEITERLHGPSPLEIRERVGALFGRVAEHMQSARDPMVAARPSEHELRLEWPTAPVIVTSQFGYRRDPILRRRQVRFHAGIDLGGRRGDPVNAAGPGRVLSAGWLGGHGRTVVLQHAGGYVTMYAHLRQILVAQGDEVDTGAAVGLIGSSGRATGPHLHFEVRHGGVPIDPLELLEQSGASLAAGEEPPHEDARDGASAGGLAQASP